MNLPFPFGFSTPTALYLSFYVLTLALHFAFMGYTLAGAALLAVRALLGRAKPPPGTLAHLVQDWLPFGLGLAITAGVAPLLFLQLCYEHAFYTANLLLFHRWMLIVPLLGFGFYLLYVLKSGLGTRHEWLWRSAAAGAFLCFLFVGWSWTENHLLSQDNAQWVEFYGSGARFYRSGGILPRLGFWICLSGVVLASWLAWQLRFEESRGPTDAHLHRQTCALGLASTLLAVLTALLQAALHPELGAAARSAVASPYSYLAAIGTLSVVAGWVVQWWQETSSKLSLVLTSAGTTALLLGVVVVREALRLQNSDLQALQRVTEQASDAGGLPAFCVFLVINGTLVAFALHSAVEAVRRPQPSERKALSSAPVD
jgi:hypothetical protein